MKRALFCKLCPRADIKKLLYTTKRKTFEHKHNVYKVSLIACVREFMYLCNYTQAYTILPTHAIYNLQSHHQVGTFIPRGICLT